MSTTQITVNGERCSTDAADVVALLRERGVDPGRSGIAVALNDEVVPRSAWGETRVHAGDRLEIVGAVQGG